MSAPTELDPRRWKALAVVCAAFFMTVLDVAIVNVALPSIQTDLDFAPQDLQWVLTAYAITFGGFLLLGGRAADLLGRRRVFLVGVAVFTLASLLCGLAQSDTMLIVSRAIQGVGAAIITPSALSIVTTTFTEGAERNKALGVWGAIGGSRRGGRRPLRRRAHGMGSAGSGSSSSTCRSASSPSSSPPGSSGRAARRGSSAASTRSARSPSPAAWRCSSTASPRRRTTAGPRAQTIVRLALAVAAPDRLRGRREPRVATPLAPLGIFHHRTLTGANIVGFLLGATIFGNFFVLTLYVQRVLGYSAIRTGLTFLCHRGHGRRGRRRRAAHDDARGRRSP